MLNSIYFIASWLKRKQKPNFACDTFSLIVKWILIHIYCFVSLYIYMIILNKLKKMNSKICCHFCFDKVDVLLTVLLGFTCRNTKWMYLYTLRIWIVAPNTPTPPPIGRKIDESVVKPVSSNKILMVETENVKDQSYEYSDQMKVRMLT